MRKLSVLKLAAESATGPYPGLPTLQACWMRQGERESSWGASTGAGGMVMVVEKEQLWRALYAGHFTVAVPRSSVSHLASFVFTLATPGTCTTVRRLMRENGLFVAAMWPEDSSGTLSLCLDC